jgi:hypothetical protein
MSSIRPIEMKLVDQLFEPPGERGYVLDFSNSSFASFFGQELGADIYQDRFAQRGNSKMNRLRCYLETVDEAKAAEALRALWEYRETLAASSKMDVPNGEKRLNELIKRLGGKPIAASTPEAAATPAKPSIDPAKRKQLCDELIRVTGLSPHARGLAFERFLRDLFTAHGMEGAGSITNRGEQIDGSFRLDGQTYLFEAKWQNEKTGAPDLHIFEGKLGQKAVWTRGLFISQSGFTEAGLDAFGRGKRLICMDGLDLWEALTGTLTLPEVITLKANRASQTGEIFVRVRDLR